GGLERSAWTGSQSADAGPASSTRRSPFRHRGRRLPARLRPPRPGDVRFMHVTGHPDGDPQRAGVAIFDVVTGLHAAIGILAALMERGERGEGQHIASTCSPPPSRGWSTRPRATRPPATIPSAWATTTRASTPTGPSRRRPGHHHLRGQREPVLPHVPGPRRPRSRHGPPFCSVRLRNVNRDELRLLMVEALAAHGVDHWSASLQPLGVPCAPILDIAQGVQRAADLGLAPIVQVGNPETRQFPSSATP
ncbi:hypothetical protein GS507_29005, partial [Rhodococcus hoagii]|nr:hypothetical protein [Prescottella equi]